MLSKEKIIEELENVEAKKHWSIVELGLVKNVEVIKSGIVKIFLAPAAFSEKITNDLKSHLMKLEGVIDVTVEVARSFPWIPSRLSRKGQAFLE